MSRIYLLFLACFLAALVPAASYGYPVNYLSAKLGASVSAEAKLRPDSDVNAILSDGPITKGGFVFADVPQKNVFTVDLGQEREFDRVHFGTDNGEGSRCPKRIRIETSSAGAEGPFTTVFEKENLGWFQVLRLPLVKARWVRFDLGEGPVGMAARAIRIYKGYEHPKMPEAAKLLHQQIKPGLPGLENYYAAADAGDWVKACSELRTYFASKFKLDDDPPNPKYDPSRAQPYFDGELDFAGIKRTEKVPIDWSYQKTTDWYEHKNFLNRGAPIGASVDAYYHTRDKKWADHWRSIFYDWIDANPKPEIMSGADYPSWRTLDSAARLGWLHSRFPKVTAVPDWEDELWANLLYSIWEHADYLKNDNFTGGNWLAINSGAVMGLAVEFPEFKDQTKWFAFGKTSFETNILRDVHPDGKEVEDAPGYVAFAYSGMLGTLESLDKAGIEVDPEARARLGRIQDFLAAVTQPNGDIAAIGDWGGGQAYTLPRAMEYFKREDTRYVWTKGKEGVKPARASVSFPYGGWSVMRSAYEEIPYENARQLVFKSSSGSHGHHDELLVTAYGYGRELLIDPGIRSYEGADVQRYTHTSYHNTICIDGNNRSRGGGKTERWVSNDGLDYLLGTQPPARSLLHRRSVVFVKPDYWVLHDDITGEDTASHTFDQNWHFAEDAGIVGDAERKTVRTGYQTGGNLLILPVSTEGLGSEIKDFLIARERKTHEAGTPSKGWKYTRTGAAPQVFDVVLYPYSGSAVPKLWARALAVADASPVDVTALKITCGSKTDYVLVSRTGAREMTLPEAKLSVSGEVVVIRTVRGKPVRVSGSNVRTVRLGGKTLIDSTEPIPDLDRPLLAK